MRQKPFFLREKVSDTKQILLMKSLVPSLNIRLIDLDLNAAFSEQEDWQIY